MVAAAAPGLGYVLWGQLRQAYVELGYTPGAELSVALELNTWGRWLRVRVPVHAATRTRSRSCRWRHRCPPPARALTCEAWRMGCCGVRVGLSVALPGAEYLDCVMPMPVRA